MKTIKKIGNLVIKYEPAGADILIKVYNGSDCVASEIYSDTTLEKACDDILMKMFDTFSREEMCKHAEGKIEWLNHTDRYVRTSFGNFVFRKIDDTNYFKQLPPRKLKAFAFDSKNLMEVFIDQYMCIYKRYAEGDDKTFYTTCGNSEDGYPLAPVPWYMELKIVEDFAEAVA
jgi:hypothetical protein